MTMYPGASTLRQPFDLTLKARILRILVPADPVAGDGLESHIDDSRLSIGCHTEIPRRSISGLVLSKYYAGQGWFEAGVPATLSASVSAWRNLPCSKKCMT